MPGLHESADQSLRTTAKRRVIGAGVEDRDNTVVGLLGSMHRKLSK